MHSLIKQSANSIENPWLIKAKLDDMPDIIWLETENWCKNILEMFLREGFIQKKKLWIFTTGGGGHPKMLTFSQLFLFFFACSNSSITAIKKIFKGVGVPPDKYTLKT